MPTCAPFDIKRHYQDLTEKETDEVVDAVADLIVTFLKGRSEPAWETEAKQHRTCDRKRPVS